MIKFAHWNSKKIAAQCVFPRIDVDTYLNDEVYRNDIKKLAEIGCGGFCIFQGNIEKVKNIIAELQMIAEIPLLFCADFENGLQMRLEDGTSFPHSMALAKTGNYTTTVANAIAKEAKNLGVLWNLAPVCDVNSNPKNPVINIRSFGEEPKIVTENTIKYVEATQFENVVACAKHFPGHGDTEVDSHSNFPVLNKNIEELERNELIPFVAAIENQVKSIMVGHLIVEKLDAENPASLSKNIVTVLLRNKLNYNGVVVSDGLDMKSITNKYTSQEIAKLAINAGIDVLLIPEKPKEIIETIQQIIENDEKMKESLLQSVNRIYNLKVWTKLIPRFASSDGNVKIFSEHLQLALKAAIEATELIFADNNFADSNTDSCTNSSTNSDADSENNKNAHSKNIRSEKELQKLIPLPESQNYAAFSIIQKADDIQAASRFFTMLAGATENDCDYAYLDETISEAELNDMKSGVIGAEFVIFALFYRGRGYAATLGSAEKINKIIAHLADGRDYIIIFFGDPYIAGTVGGKIKILTYSDSFASLASAIMTLTGRKMD